MKPYRLSNPHNNRKAKDEQTLTFRT
jgi:hypothetical protein